LDAFHTVAKDQRVLIEISFSLRSSSLAKLALTFCTGPDCKIFPTSWSVSGVGDGPDVSPCFADGTIWRVEPVDAPE
jgi:hypothetical protein